MRFSNEAPMMLSEPGTAAVCRGILDTSGGFWGNGDCRVVAGTC